MKKPLDCWARLPLRANCPANTLDPSRLCDQDADIMASIDIGEILLVAANTEKIDQPGDFSALLSSLITENFRLCMEIVKDYVQVLHVSALEDRYPQDEDEYAHLYAEDDHGISSLEIRTLPVGGGANIHVSYRGFLKEVFEFSQFPAWNSLKVVFHRGEWI